MPPAPRPQHRLAMAVFVLIAFAGIGLSGLLAAQGRVDVLPYPDVPVYERTIEPPVYREDGPYLLVCPADPEAFAARNEGVEYLRRLENERLYEECQDSGFPSLPAALAQSEPGMRVLILPGDYTLDEPARVPEDLENLQIEGRGDGPEDVLLSGRFALDTVMEVDGAPGLYLKGFTLGQAREKALGLLSWGATVEAVAAVQSGGAGIHLSGSRAVVLTDCRAESADTAGILIEESDADVSGCEATGNTVGVWYWGSSATGRIAGNRLHGNTTGIAVEHTGARPEIPGVDVADNLIYGNNTDHYDHLGTAACRAPLDERAWGEVLCPDFAVPAGVGLLVAESDKLTATGNRIWDQQTAAIAAWGGTGTDFQASGDQNTFSGNTFGIREDGQRQRNRVDLWWDGTGTDLCFDEPGAFRSSPAVLPDCDATLQPSRIAGDPMKTLKVAVCGVDRTEELPDGCDWFGARFTDRLEFQAVVVFAASLLFLTGAGWLAAARTDDPPRAGRMTFSAMATGAGGLLLVLAVWSGRADYEALATGLWGFGWLLAGRSWRQCGMVFFGLFTGLIGAVAVLDAVDRAVWTLPFVPVAPAWIWAALLPLWTLVALSLALGPRRREEEPIPVERTPVTAPAHDRFDW
ncbi:right-handed parallel beta-helix repeat-containing protein [Glycomyces algeriensis]|uniref:Right handed beta helix domain-containing protein n=1 Tax=Glycomyces algeriensis TaxID=256037 RepID=A0A9W6LF43_9ACTN|nr:right-handed parallel beta-helix repeat-containing protein [Glycomyces algeriensis]MDA1367664.1 right-handed parallel beta-helix repeat-containing protein [Glycomyces algeriensis]MDR7353005.1 parallel beta-helix repeat protein [Glycomyces algeriensis]GLI40695.1 hypothetical protein GALLR39Z86_05450 [Glycomyces algeriensis]